MILRLTVESVDLRPLHRRARSALGCAKRPIQRLTTTLYPLVKCRGVKLTTNLRLLPRLLYTFCNSMGTRVSQFSVVARIADGRQKNQDKTFVRCIVFCLLHTAQTYTEVCPASCLLSVWGSVLWREVSVERSSRMYMSRVFSIVNETGRLEILASQSRGFL
jgi:hypothetical protein